MTTLDMNPSLGAPNRVRRLAHTVPLLTLPSGLWRIALVIGLPLTNAEVGGFWMRVYIVSLSLVSEGAALLTLGLVQPWGEVAPRWIPLIGGRPVRPLAAFIPAITGAAILTALWTWVFWGMAGSEFYDYFKRPASGPGHRLLPAVAPLGSAAGSRRHRLPPAPPVVIPPVEPVEPHCPFSTGSRGGGVGLNERWFRPCRAPTHRAGRG